MNKIVLLIGLILTSGQAFSKDLYFNGSVYKDYSDTADLSLSYDLLPSEEIGLEIALGYIAKTAKTEEEETNVNGGYLGLNINQVITPKLLSNYRFSFGAEKAGDLTDTFIENRIGFILTSTIAHAPRGVEIGVSVKNYIKDSDDSLYRESDNFIYPYIGISI